MIYFDTNVLIYATVNQDDGKRLLSQDKIRDAERNKRLLISPLSIQEFSFVLRKLSIPDDAIFQKASFFLNFCHHNIDCTLLAEACELASIANSYQSINDTIHLKFAERYARKLVTFDSDFKRFARFTTIDLEILK
ncbi:MAG: type II toxin-antitoxin system VapC family toxin [Desulfamplus sp.]|nr:type II toxin-antitoxin system VapC family toxin [Desulfamplus sp.]